MYGDFFLIDRPGEPVRRATKLPFGDTRGRNEAWLRDLLLAHPEVLPISDIDPSFGPLLPLCRELRTEAGPLDLAFINPFGRLTLVECKLWRNPEARRKVVAQVLDYARVITRWSYSDLQRQVSIATGRKGNVPFEVAWSIAPDLIEHNFADAVTQTMRSGRFLLLIAGDGIREDVGALAELINRNAAAGFSFGLVEVALYDLGSEGGLAIQPRVVAKSHLIERGVVLLREEGLYLDSAEEDGASVEPITRPRSQPERFEVESSRHAEYRRWWQPVLDMSFDDPDQDPPKLYFPTNVRAQLPWPGTWVTAYGGADHYGVFLSGREGAFAELWDQLRDERDEIVAQLPEGTTVGEVRASGGVSIITRRPKAAFASDGDARDWLARTLNAYVN